MAAWSASRLRLWLPVAVNSSSDDEGESSTIIVAARECGGVVGRRVERSRGGRTGLAGVPLATVVELPTRGGNAGLLGVQCS